jgi:hypothetical protein
MTYRGHRLQTQAPPDPTGARDAYSPEAVDRAAIFVPPAQRPDAA